MPDLGQLAALGDGRSVALLDEDGTVCWWAAPRLDTTPLVSGLVEPGTGGRFALGFRDTLERTRTYLAETNVLRTEVRTATGRAVVTESLNSGVAGRLPWAELARRVECVEGEVALDWELVAGTGLRSWSPWTEQVEDQVVVHADLLLAGLVHSQGISVSREHQRVSGSARLTAGDRELLGVTVTVDEPVMLPDWRAVDARIDASVEGWQRWSRQLDIHGPDRDPVVRSALALKLVLMSATGAIAAAATTSLPEQLGGGKNWDYRLAWIRDAAFSIDALRSLGLTEEVHAAVSWLLAAIRRDGLQVLYTLDGTVPGEEKYADVGGFAGSTPVRVGNRARSQLQHGIYGDLFGTVTSWVDDGHVLDIGSRRQLADLADRCADEWQLPDAGMWELEEARHYTSSKIGCWRALRCASILAERGLIAGRGDRWQEEAEQVRAFIENDCWDEGIGAYTMSPGDGRLDVAVLLGSRFEFDRGPRMRSTADAIEEQLGAGNGLLHRYSGVQDEEGCFLAASWWLVETLAETGDVARARELLGVLDTSARGPLGLMTELRSPDGTWLGNLPQALSHLAHISAVVAVARRE